ncbi:hypothetical protein DH2020_006981 [Rehmannia glutinosa]|uniref:MBD domain-containing protein n=1 Tax=Rehmannia glutinosa TaxID=99300 RepID=A0ABR0W5Q2_REHGL
MKQRHNSTVSPPNSMLKSEHPKMIVSGGKLLRLDDELSQSHLAVVPSGKATPFILPDGWIVEEVPRKYNSWTSKYYYEPGTGRKFRSLVAVERHLAELEENAPLSKALEEIKENKPLSKVFKLENLTKNSKKNNCRENTQASSFIDPPMKVNWVLASPQGDAWNPFISETLVPDAVKEQWTKRFMLFMNDGNSNFHGKGGLNQKQNIFARANCRHPPINLNLQKAASIEQTKMLETVSK